MNSAKLKGVIIAHGENQGILANAMGLSQSNLSDKINDKSDFRKNEIKFICTRYKLTGQEIVEIFFAELVS